MSREHNRIRGRIPHYAQSVKEFARSNARDYTEVRMEDSIHGEPEFEPPFQVNPGFLVTLYVASKRKDKEN